MTGASLGNVAMDKSTPALRRRFSSLPELEGEEQEDGQEEKAALLLRSSQPAFLVSVWFCPVLGHRVCFGKHNYISQ